MKNSSLMIRGLRRRGPKNRNRNARHAETRGFLLSAQTFEQATMASAANPLDLLEEKHRTLIRNRY